MKVDPLLAAAVATLVTFGVTYVAFGGKFPFTRTPLRMLLAGFLAFVVGYAVLATGVATQQ